MGIGQVRSESESAAVNATSGTVTRRPYSPPRVTPLGSVRQVTLGTGRPNSDTNPFAKKKKT